MEDKCLVSNNQNLSLNKRKRLFGIMDTQAKNSISASCRQGYNYRIRQVYTAL